MKEVFESICQYMERGEPCVLVSAVGGEGSAPRKTQSHMLVAASGHVCGTVGGGAVEGNSIAYAKELLQTQMSSNRTFELYEHAAQDIGMICGGKVNVHFQYISAQDTDIRAVAQAAVSAFEEGKNTWLAIDLRRHVLKIYDGSTCSGEYMPAALTARRTSSSEIWLEGEEKYYCGAVSQITLEDLHRNHAVQTVAFCLIDICHTAGANQLKDLISIVQHFSNVLIHK